MFYEDHKDVFLFFKTPSTTSIYGKKRNLNKLDDTKKTQELKEPQNTMIKKK